MANWSNLKAAIANIVKTNGNQEITALLLKNCLDSIISNVGANATFAGVALPTTNPGIPDGPVFYFAFTSGVYSNFDGAVIKNVDNVRIFKWDNSTWTIIDTGLSNSTKVTQLINEVSNELLSKVDNAVQKLNEDINGITKDLSEKVDRELQDLSEKVDNQKEQVDAARNEAINTINKAEQNILNNFNTQRVTPEMLSESTLQLINSAGGGVINNAADDEDLYSTGGDTNVIKFKDKDYNKENFSGLGRVYLRKNISANKNILSQDMIDKSYTRYIIQYDYDLNGEKITIPDGCILDFQGGSISNGVIYTKGLNIIAPYKTIFIDVDVESGSTFDPNLSFIDIWSNKPFYRIFPAIRNLIITKDWTIKHGVDWVYHKLYNEDTINIYGNGHTIIFDTNELDGSNKTTFIAGKYVYIENLNIKIEDSSTNEKISTIIDCVQCTLINVYFYGYNRLAVNWTYVDINVDSKLYVSNCRLYTTSFIFEHIFSEVELYSSTIEILRDIRSDYQSKIISCSAYRNDDKSHVIIKDCNIVGEWELVYNGSDGFRDGDIYNYKQFDIYNSNLRLFNITYDDNKLIKSSLVANYHNCHITKYMACNTLNGIKEINHYDCNFIYDASINIYGNLPFNIISADTITFYNCNFGIKSNSNSLPIITVRDSAADNDSASYKFIFDNCNIVFESQNQNIIYNLINNRYDNNVFYNSDLTKAVIVRNLRLLYLDDINTTYTKAVQVTNGSVRYLIPAENSKLNRYTVENYNLILLKNFFVILLIDRMAIFYNGKFYPKEVIRYGPTINRPAYYVRDYEVGYFYFDTDLGIPIWWNGSAWIKYDGTRV